MEWEKLNDLNPVPPEGKKLVIGSPPDHREGYLVVGEAPGKEEVLAGEPFVGRAGQLLRQTLDEWGVRPVHFTNACLWRPGDGAEDVKPTQREVAACLPRLWALIAWYRPKRILAVGAVAAAALGKFCSGVMRRGTVKTVTIGGEQYHVWITHHPAYPLYEPDYWIDFYEDVGRFARGERPDDRPTVHVEICEPAPIVAVDVEMTSVLPGQGRLLCAAVASQPGYAVVGNVETVLCSIPADAVLVGHNSLVDEVALRLAGYDNVCFGEDTLLYHYAHDERKRTHSLKTLAPVVARCTTEEDIIAPYLRNGEDDDEGGIAAAPEDILYRYNARDADATLRLWYALREKYQHDENTSLYEFLMRIRNMLVEATLRGLAVDSRALQEAIDQQEARVADLMATLPVNPNSPEQVLTWLRQEGYAVADTREETLRGLEGTVPAQILAYREEAKILDAFLRPLMHVGGEVIRPSYKIHGTETGRLSCHDPNIQQFPERLKHLIVARPDMVFVGWDFSQLEIRVQAWLCGDPIMTQALMEDVDFHQRTGDLLGIDRQSAKRLNFLIQYGGGAAKASRALGISRSRAAQLIEEYYRTYAGLRKWKSQVTQRMIDTGVLVTPYGRRRHFDFLTDENLPEREREGHNFLVQSLSSDINLDVALRMYQRTGIPPLLLVHDFAAFEVPADFVQAFMADIRQSLLDVLGPLRPTVPIAMSVKAGPNWGAMKEVTALVVRPTELPT